MRRSSANEGLLRFWVALAVDSLWAEGRFPVPRMFGIGRPGFLNCLFIHCKFFLKEKKNLRSLNLILFFIVLVEYWLGSYQHG